MRSQENSLRAVIQEVINTTLKFLLEEPESADQIEAAIIEVGRLLSDSAAPFLPQYGPLSAAPLLRVCTLAPRFMVKSILKDFDHHSKTFLIMDYDDSLFSARENVIFAIQDMDNRVQTAACRPQPQLSTSEGSQEGLLEEKEDSPEVSLDETTTVRTSMLRLEANMIVHMEPELDQKVGFLEEREASPDISRRSDSHCEDILILKTGDQRDCIHGAKARSPAGGVGGLRSSEKDEEEEESVCLLPWHLEDNVMLLPLSL
ncbi:uncharacterized protein [Thunnus thynnus]|uniref:uncharacterized protein n=1 Tax=Thunnus thynnus TaxID=8237 RepID=UPI003528D1B5